MWHSSFLPTTTTTTTQQQHRQPPPHSTQCQQWGTTKLTAHEPQWLPMNQNDCPRTPMTTHRWKHSHTFHAESRCHVADGDMATNNERWHWSSFVVSVWWVTSQIHSNSAHWQPDDERRHLSSFIDTSQWWRMRQQHRSMTQRPWNNNTARMRDANTHGKDTGQRHTNTQQHTTMMTWNKDTQQCGSKIRNDEHMTMTDHPHVGMRLTTPPSPFRLTPPFPSTSSPFPSTSPPSLQHPSFLIPLPSTSPFPSTHPFP